ncbi:MAG: hypothetical protein K2V38_12120, partial [Gemmataceae bacterium]|nr:hypothetical protein [Gemmataceae bacterium]
MLPRNLLASSIARPGTAAAALGGVTGQSAPFGHPCVAAALAVGAPVGYELRDRIKIGMPLVLGAVPGPSQFETLVTAAATSRAVEPKPLPAEAVRPDLLKKAAEARATALVGSVPSGDPMMRFAPDKGDLGKFAEELDKLSSKGRLNPKDATAVKAITDYIEKFRAERGLTEAGVHFGSTTAPRDEWTIEDDPGLAPLVQAQKEGLTLGHGARGDNLYAPFGRTFFWTIERGFGEPRRVPSGGLYQVRNYPEDVSQVREGRRHYVYWVTEDIPAKQRNAIADSTTKVVREGWRNLKAREEARKQAEAIAEAVRKGAAASSVTVRQVLTEAQVRVLDGVTDPKVRARVEPFELRDVCPLAPIDTAGLPNETLLRLSMTDELRRPRPFQLRESAKIPFPTRDMEKALLDHRDKPAGTAVVIPDASKNTYYVAVVTRSSADLLSQKSASDFKGNVYSRDGPARGVLFDFRDKESRDGYQQVVELLKKEFRYEATEEQQKKLDEGAKSGRE